MTIRLSISAVDNINRSRTDGHLHYVESTTGVCSKYLYRNLDRMAEFGIVHAKGYSSHVHLLKVVFCGVWLNTSRGSLPKVRDSSGLETKQLTCGSGDPRILL